LKEQVKEKKTSILKKYFSLVRVSILNTLVFRINCITTLIGDLVYLIIIYFLWKAIYASVGTEVVDGMTFYQTMVYLVLASAMYNVMNCWVTYSLGEDYLSGNLINFMIKPMDFQILYFLSAFGRIIMTFFMSFLPTFVIVWFIARNHLVLGWNLIFFLISIICGILINFCVDFFVGLICFYTQSVWGVNIMKDVVVALLSGATVPLAFFPEAFRKVIDLLPFQAIYNTPLEMLTNPSLTVTDYGPMLLQQLFWVVVTLEVCRIFWRIASKKITVNGG